MGHLMEPVYSIVWKFHYLLYKLLLLGIYINQYVTDFSLL